MSLSSTRVQANTARSMNVIWKLDRCVRAVLFGSICSLALLAGCSSAKGQTRTPEAPEQAFARSEMLKSLDRVGLSADRDNYERALAIVEELKRSDPGWFQRTGKSIQFDEIAIMVKERLATGRAKTPDQSLVNTLTNDARERKSLLWYQETHPAEANDRESLRSALDIFRDYDQRYQFNVSRFGINIPMRRQKNCTS